MESIAVAEPVTSALPSILSQTHQTELRDLIEDWTGITDPAVRRKLQNRLHQRAWRRRKAAERRNNIKAISTTAHSPVPPPTSQSNEQEGHTSHTIPNEIDTDINAKRTERNLVCRSGSAQARSDFEQYAINLWASGSPRTDLLLSLIKFNVFRALSDNTAVLGFPASEWLDCDAISSFYWNRESNGSYDHTPSSLRPTRLQQTVEHHPWIDLFPLPQMRDNILVGVGDDFDDTPLCQDLVEDQTSPGDSSGLIVWGDPWEPSNWEVSEEFVTKWSWVVRGCWELFKSTNQWRTTRGEEPLLFSDRKLQA